MSRGSDESGDTAFGWAASGSVAEAASGLEDEAASDSVAEAAPPPSVSGSEDSTDPGSEDVGASTLGELSGLVSVTEVSTIGLSLGASSGEGEAGGLAGELDMMEQKKDIQNAISSLLPGGGRKHT